MTTADLLVAVLAREVGDDDLVGVGLGTPLALCATLVARRTHAPGAQFLVAGAVSPDADLLTCMRGASALSGRTPGFAAHVDTMDMAERQAMTLQFLRPAQVDRTGSVNTSAVQSSGHGTSRLPGGLAMADVPKLLPRVVLYHTDHRPRALVERVHVVTGRGGASRFGRFGALGPTMLVTNLCVMAFEPEGVRLVSVHPGVAVERAREQTGFDLSAEPPVPVTDPPSQNEVAAMREVDPHALRGIEVRDTREEAAGRLTRLLGEES